MNEDERSWRVCYYDDIVGLFAQSWRKTQPDKWYDMDDRYGRSFSQRFDTEEEAEAFIEEIYKFLGVMDFHRKYGK